MSDFFNFFLYKAYWCTGPGLGGCDNCSSIQYNTSTPLIFNVGQDPSEVRHLRAFFLFWDRWGQDWALLTDFSAPPHKIPPALRDVRLMPTLIGW